MRWSQKVYHDENYRDPQPLGYCILCGEPVLKSDCRYRIYGDLIHLECLEGWAEEFKEEP